jgi:ribokinase
MAGQGVAILGIFVADLAFRAGRQPKIGETIIGSGFAMGPGGKGSNQAVAAARAGATVTFISKLGKDAFANIAIQAWSKEGITPFVAQMPDQPTGAAYIFVNDQNGENAIIVVPGAAGTITAADVDAAANVIASSAVFVTQLEQPIPAAMRSLEIARQASVITIFNPAPATPVPDAIYPLCDYVIPNESEAEGLTGIKVSNPDDARKAAEVLVRKGARTAIVTMGGLGALVHSKDKQGFFPSFFAGKVIETAGAGDAFVGAFAAAIAAGADMMLAGRFASAAAGISVTRPGTAPSMPYLAEIEKLLM